MSFSPALLMLLAPLLSVSSCGLTTLRLFYSGSSCTVNGVFNGYQASWLGLAEHFAGMVGAAHQRPGGNMAKADLLGLLR